MKKRLNTELWLKPSWQSRDDIAVHRYVPKLIPFNTDDNDDDNRYQSSYHSFPSIKRSQRRCLASYQLLLFLISVAVGAFLFGTLVFPFTHPHCHLALSGCLNRRQNPCVATSSPLCPSAPSPSFAPKAEKALLFIGVMTSKNYADTRARALYRAWGSKVDGSLVFFAAEDQPWPSDLPMIRLPTVTDVYPPQKKSFAMLKFMYDNYLDDYEWFVRADDDVFFKVIQRCLWKR